MRLRMKNSTQYHAPRAARISELGARNSAQQSGFLLIEALIAIVILSIVTVTFLAGMAQALKVQDKVNRTTEAILQFEKLLYELETGRRHDLLTYGGREKLQTYDLEVKSEELNPTRRTQDLPSFYHLKIKLSWKDAREFLSFETVAPEILNSEF